MERSSDEHGARIDEDLDRMTQSVTRGGPVESRAEEEREQEGPADEEPVPDAVIHGPRGDVELRSEIARHLEPSAFPASREDVIRSAHREHAPAEVLRWLERLPDGRYPNFESVWEALGGQRERRS
jgi:Protein of unknown function (DUF2795)